MDVIRVGHVEVRPQEGLALVDGRPLVLSVREFHLLVELTRRAGRIVTREELFRLVWGAEMRSGDRSVDVYVHKLRVKLDGAAEGVGHIHTHVGFGYRFDPEPSPGFDGERGLHTHFTSGAQLSNRLAAVEWKPAAGNPSTEE